MKVAVPLRFVVLALSLASCAAAPKKEPARLRARPQKTAEACVPGLHPLGLASGRDGQFFIPAAAASGKRLPLVVFLHGATQDSELAMRALREDSEREGFLLLAPESRGMTWDAISGSFGPDIDFIDRALERAFRQCPVDPGHLTLAGFSDGATYALSLGLANGDLFSRIIAFSPGFIVPAGQTGKPLVFISHGTRDRILPIDRTTRPIVDTLQSAGYNVVSREFDGPHTMPREIIAQALKWAK